MNWNNNDTKYILKRLLLYLIITGIVFFAGQRCAKAMEVFSSNWLGNSSYNLTQGNNYLSIGSPNNAIFRNKGKGYLTFTMTYFNSSNNVNVGLQYVTIQQYNYDGASNAFNCDIGNMTSYYDSDKWFYFTTVTCPVDLTNNQGIGKINIKRITNNGDMQFFFSEVMNFIGESGNGSQDIINANNQATSQILSSQAGIDNAINTYGQQAHNDAQAVATAIQNQSTEIIANTQAIEDLNDTITADLSPTIPTDFLDGLDGLFTQNDDNIIRQFLFIPINFFVIIYNAATSNTCSAISLGSLYGTNLVMPCIQWDQLIGSTLYSIIDTIMGCCILFGIIRFLRTYINLLFTINSKASDYCVEVFK